MRFEFCGNLPCPEWFIAESSVLTKITAIKLKLIVGYLITRLLDDSDITDKAYKLLDGSGFTVNEMNAILSTLQFILRNCIMFSITDTILNKQLVDLGLPRENVQSISKTYKQSREKLIERHSNEFLKLASEPTVQYSVNELIHCKAFGQNVSTNNLPAKFCEVTMKYRDIEKIEQKCSFAITETRVDQLVAELEKAHAIMLKLDGSSD